MPYAPDEAPVVTHLYVWIRPGDEAPATRVDLGSHAVVLGARRSINIGSADTCHVMLDLADVAAVHAQFFALGHHHLLRLSPRSTATTAAGRVFGPGGEHRVDLRPFRIATVELQFELASRPIVGRWALLEIP